MIATQTPFARPIRILFRLCAAGRAVALAMMFAACGPATRFNRDAVEEFVEIDIVRAEDAGTEVAERPDVQDAGGPIPDGGLLPVEVAAGGNFSCARSGVGTVRCWGSNMVGQLGDGTMVSRLLPGAEAGPLSNVAQVVTGDTHACARTNAGTVYCWGSNMFGELGNGTPGPRNRPTRIPDLANVVQIVAGGAHTCARLGDGTLRCWGANMYSQCGNNAFAQSVESPVRVIGITNARDLSAGGLHTCAVLESGGVSCWGSNTHGQLGDGSDVTHAMVPVPTMNLGGPAVKIAAGQSHTCAVLTDGTVRCWGRNDFGQLGIGSMVESRTPATVNAVNALSIAAGGVLTAGHTCAVNMMNAVVCWGENGFGQLGDQTRETRLVPTATGVTGVAQISAGNGHTCAVGDGMITCWGANAAGQLGNGAMAVSASTPTTVMW